MIVFPVTDTQEPTLAFVVTDTPSPMKRSSVIVSADPRRTVRAAETEPVMMAGPITLRLRSVSTLDNPLTDIPAVAKITPVAENGPTVTTGPINETGAAICTPPVADKPESNRASPCTLSPLPSAVAACILAPPNTAVFPVTDRSQPTDASVSISADPLSHWSPIPIDPANVHESRRETSSSTSSVPIMDSELEQPAVTIPVTDTSLPAEMHP